MNVLKILTLISLLTSCANTPLLVYKDSDALNSKPGVPSLIKVRQFKPGVLSTLSYKLGVRNTVHGYYKKSTLSPVYEFRTVLGRHKYTGYDRNYRDYLEFLETKTKPNANLDNKDITIFEFKIIGIHSKTETIVTKRFTGPVKRFDWAKLFRNKVPKDATGHLLTGKAYINYIPFLENPSTDFSPAEIEEEDRKHLIPLPIELEAELEYKNNFYKGEIKAESGSACLFGGYTNAPLAKVDFINKDLKGKKYHIINSARGFVKSISVQYNEKWCTHSNETARDIYRNKIFQIGNKMYTNAYFLNKNFVLGNGLLKTNREMKRTKRRLTREKAMFMTYKDDIALLEINKTMSEARSAFGKMSRTCSGSIEGVNRTSHALSSFGSKHRSRNYSKKYHNFNNLMSRLNYYQSEVAKATAKFENLFTQEGGIQASTRPLRFYSSEVRMTLINLNSAKAHCARFNSAISSLGSGSSQSTPNFMDALGSALTDSYTKSIKKRTQYTPSTKASQTYYPKQDSTLSIFQNANIKSMHAIRMSQINQKSKSTEYVNALRQIRATNQAVSSSQLIGNKKGINQNTKHDAKMVCIAKGGKFIEQTRNCLITKNINTAVVTKLPVNRVGNLGKKSSPLNIDTNNKTAKSSKCSGVIPTSSTHPLPILSAEGKGLSAFNKLTSLVNDHMQEKCGQYNFRINGSSIVRSTKEVIKKTKLGVNNLERVTAKPGQTFSCGCNFTGEKERSSSGQGVSK